MSTLATNGRRISKNPGRGAGLSCSPGSSAACPGIGSVTLTRHVDEGLGAKWICTRLLHQKRRAGTQVHVIPNGVAPLFWESQAAFPLKTQKSFRFLFVGGTIQRKGIDLLLNAYHQVFTARDDVCLVIKDMGVNSFYERSNRHDFIARCQERPNAPEVEAPVQTNCQARRNGGRLFGVPLLGPVPPIAVRGLQVAHCGGHGLRSSGAGNRLRSGTGFLPTRPRLSDSRPPWPGAEPKESVTWKPSIGLFGPKSIWTP